MSQNYALIVFFTFFIIKIALVSFLSQEKVITQTARKVEIKGAVSWGFGIIFKSIFD